MMKVIMRPQKTQLKQTLFRWTPSTTGTGYFRKAPYQMAGYKSFDVMTVGGAGGRSGRAGQPGYHYTYEAGGGGGGSMRRNGLIKNMSAVVRATPGACGAFGGSVGTSGGGPVYAGVGGTGGTSGLYDEANNPICYAPGGEGGFGGYSTVNQGQGGSAGGAGGFSEGGNIGAWRDDIQQGAGGRGGQGDMTSTDLVNAQNGSNGAMYGGGNGYAAPGTGTESGVIGGTGGGCQVASLTGQNELYGGSAPNGPTADGAVILKIT